MLRQSLSPVGIAYRSATTPQIASPYTLAPLNFPRLSFPTPFTDNFRAPLLSSKRLNSGQTIPPSEPTKAGDPFNPVIKNDYFLKNPDVKSVQNTEDSQRFRELKHDRLSNPKRRQFPPLDHFDRVLDYTPYDDPEGLVDLGVNFPRIKYKLSSFPKLNDLPAEDILEEQTYFNRSEFRNLYKRVLVSRRVVCMTAAGKKRSFSIHAVVGNKNGSAGLGHGRGKTHALAVKRAIIDAYKNMEVFDRFENRTVYHDISLKYRCSNVNFLARRPGYGRRIHHLIHEICIAIGIQDLGGKVSLSRNPMNICKAAFEALRKQRTPEEMARGRGMKVHDVYHTYYGKVSSK